MNNDSERLDAVIKNQWVVGNDPSGCFKRFIVQRLPFDWPVSVVADGDTDRDAYRRRYFG